MGMIEEGVVALVVNPARVAREVVGDVHEVPNLDGINVKWADMLRGAVALPVAADGGTDWFDVRGNLLEVVVKSDMCFPKHQVDAVERVHPHATWRAGFVHGYGVAVAFDASGDVAGVVAAMVESYGSA